MGVKQNDKNIKNSGCCILKGHHTFRFLIHTEKDPNKQLPSPLASRTVQEFEKHIRQVFQLNKIAYRNVNSEWTTI